MRFVSTQSLFWNMAVALACVAVAVAGTALLPTVNPLVAVWPVTGVALAAFLLRGANLWPGVLLANLLVHALMQIPPSVGVAISITGTLAPMLGAWLLLHRLQFDTSLSRLGDVIRLVVIGCLQAVAAPTIGIVFLARTQSLAWSGAPYLWLLWSMADCLGVLAVVPVLLSVFNRRAEPAGKFTAEMLASVIALVIVTGFFFSQRPPVGYPVLLVVIWVTVRFPQRHVAAAILGVTAIALWQSMHGAGLSLTSAAPSLSRVLDFLIFMATGTLILSGLVSERRAAEMLLLRANQNRLQESEARFKDAFEAAAQGMAIVSPQGRYLRVNAALCRLTGYDEAQLLARDFQSITHADDLAYDYEQLKALLSGEVTSSQFEKRFIHKSGEIVTALLSVSVVRDADDNALYFVVQVLDITGQKRAEQLWRFGLESAGDVVWDWDIPSGKMSLSGRTQELFGYLPGQEPATQMAWRDSVHPDDVEQSQRNITAMIESPGGHYSCEYRIRCQDGSYKWLLSRGLVISRDQNDRPIRAVGTFADMTTVRAADTERVALLKQYSDFVMSARDSIIVIDRQGCIRMSNPATTEVFGYSRDELLHRPLEMLLDDDADDFHVDRIQKLFELSDTVPPAARLRTVKARNRNGEQLLLQITLSKSNLHDKELATAMIRDVTEVERLQEKLHQSDKMSALGQLSGGIAHDVNNDLGVIMGSAELLLERAQSGSRDEVLSSRIIATVRRSMDLVRRMLVFSRQANIEPEDLELLDFLNGFLDTLGRTLGGQIQVRLHVDDADAKFWVRLDRSMLESCLINLSINARDAMAGGGVLTFSLSTEPGTVALLIGDTGSGMSEAVQRKIFEPFFTTKPAGGGTGLGLAMVYGFVQQSEGRIDVQSVIGQGTKFTLRFPKRAAPASSDLVAGAAQPDNGAPRRHAILLVDDNDMLRTTLREQFESLHCSVHEAATFEQAKSILESGAAIDFVVSDFDLGAGPNGMELARWMAAKGYKIPGAIISGYLNFPATALSDWQSLQKPIALRDLKKLLETIEDHPHGFAEPAPMPPKDLQPAPPAPGHGAAILVVEDNVDMRAVAVEILARHGYATLEAQSAEEALVLLEDRASLVQLVLTDLGLPDMSGKELADHVNRAYPAIQVVLMSGTLSSIASVGDQLGAHFLQKPFTRDSLIQSVAAALAQRAGAV